MRNKQLLLFISLFVIIDSLIKDILNIIIILFIESILLFILLRISNMAGDVSIINFN